LNDRASNSNNPYDDVGYYHNLLVEEAIENYGIIEDVTIEDVFDQIKSSIYKDEIQTKYPKETFSTVTSNLIDLFSDDYIISKANIDGAITNLDFSLNGKTYLYDIIDIIYSQEETSFNYDSYHTAIVNIENDVLNDSNLKHEEQELILKSASVARYTVDLWLNKYYNLEQKHITRGKRKMCTWSIIGCADVSGMIARGKVTEAGTLSKIAYDLTAPEKGRHGETTPLAGS